VSEAHRMGRLLLAALVLGAAGGMVWADCTPQWLFGPGQGVPGTDGIVCAMATWDPDGPGPQPELLVIGGDFAMAGNVSASSIAQWNGTSWQSLGTGVGGPYPYVIAVAVYNSDLIAGGVFATAGGVSANSIARWDGTSWHTLGAGVSSGSTYTTVYALAVYNGELIAGGDFATAGGVSANHIARWDGTSWHPLGTWTSGWVQALAIYNGELIAGGSFTPPGGNPENGIARWDGTSWQALGMGIAYSSFDVGVRALTVYNGELIAGGYFSAAGGVTVNGIARWDGTSWQALGTGMGGFRPSAFALNVYDGDLIAGGRFTSAGDISANYIALWDGANWHPMGAGMSGSTYPSVYAMAAYNNDLIAGGGFTVADGNPANYIARWGCAPPAVCPGDMNCDGRVTFADIDPFVEALGGESAWNQSHPGCPWLNADCDGSGTVTFADIDPFVAVIGRTCP
jgi:hypothetical protein